MTDQTVSLPVPAVRGPVAPNAREIATMAAGAAPVVDTINIDKSSDVHIGPKIVSVVQNIDNAEKVKGINASWYMRRSEWNAIEDVEIELLNLPIHYVIITHSAVSYCDNRRDCSARVRSIQDNHIFRGFSDVGPNFLVGGNGYILEGRGANIQGGTLSSWNTIIIGIMFLGNYKMDGDDVDDAQINNLQIILDRLLELNILSPDYELLGHCQLTQSRNPGVNVQDILHKFPHWNPNDFNTCLRT